MVNETGEAPKPGKVINETEMNEKLPEHYGSTASFAIKETFDAIKAKLESAERRMDQFGLSKGDKKQQRKKDVHEFQGAEDPVCEEEQNDKVEEDGFKKPLSGRSSRSLKGGRRPMERAK